MKNSSPKLLVLISALALAFAGYARAADAKPVKEEITAADLAKYDTNKDGKLDDAEKAAMKAAKAKLKAEAEAKEKAAAATKKS